MFFKDKPIYKPGFSYCLQKFAWRPTRVERGTVWLEFYSATRRYEGEGRWTDLYNDRNTYYC